MHGGGDYQHIQNTGQPRNQHTGLVLPLAQASPTSNAADTGLHLRVAPGIEQVQRELVLCIDDPDEEEPAALQRRDRQVLYVTIRELAVPQRHSTSRVGGRQLPGGVHHDDVKLRGCRQARPVVGGDIGMDGNAVGRNLKRSQEELTWSPCNMPHVG